MTTEPIKLSLMLQASVEQAWDFLVVPRHLAEWFGPHLWLDARPGGRMEERWQEGGRPMLTSGIVDACQPPEILSMTWADSDWPTQTRVTFLLEARGGRTRLTLTHENWGELGDALRAAHEAGWRAHLRSLADYAEGPGFKAN